MFEFRTLGTLSLQGPEGHEIASVLAQPKRVALLAYLASIAAQGFHRRDELLALFWPERDQEHARSALRKALHFLRCALGDGVIVTRGAEEVGLDSTVLQCDAVMFEILLDGGKAREALEWYAGDFLTGFHLSHCPEFERWMEDRRSRLRERAAQAAWSLAEQAGASGRPRNAVYWGQRAVALSPYDDGLVRELMGLLDRVGERAGALQAYVAFARRLREELATDPAPETRALAERVRVRTAVNGPGGAATPPPEPLGPLALPGEAKTGARSRIGQHGWHMTLAVAALTTLTLTTWRAYRALGAPPGEAEPEFAADNSAGRRVRADELWIRGREIMNHSRTSADNESAIEFMTKALAVDPSYARPYAGLAIAYGKRAAYFGFPTFWHDSALAMATKAVQLGTLIPEAYRAIAIVHIQMHRKRQAIAADLKAIRLNPNYFYAVYPVASNYVHLGEFDEALAWLHKLVSIEPRPNDGETTWAMAYLGLEEFDQAEVWAEKALRRDSSNAWSLAVSAVIFLAQQKYDRAKERAEHGLGLNPANAISLNAAADVALFTGDNTKARQLYQRALAASSTEPWDVNVYDGRRNTTSLGLVLWKAGELDSALQLLGTSNTLSRAMLENGSDWWAYPYDLSAVNAIQGNKEQAYAWLERAVAAGWRHYRLGEQDPVFENLHREARFKGIMVRVRGMVGEMRRRVEEQNTLGPGRDP